MEVSLLSRQCFGKRRIGDIACLRQQTRTWNRRMNRDRVTIQWKFTRKQARHNVSLHNQAVEALDASPCS